MPLSKQIMFKVRKNAGFIIVILRKSFKRESLFNDVSDHTSPKIKKSRDFRLKTFDFLKFSCKGSNLNPQSQNLMCYHYTTGKYNNLVRVRISYWSNRMQIYKKRGIL